MSDATPLVVAAATGYLSEVVGIVERPHPGFGRYRIVGVTFIEGPFDQRPLVDDLAGRLGVPVLDSLGDGAGDAHVAITGGSVAQRQQLASGCRLATLVHADATIGPWVDLAEGVVVSPGARITGNVVVGTGSLVHTNAVLSHDDRVGDWVTVSPSATLCGGVTVGDRSTVFAGATVMPGRSIGIDAVVGAGALVNRDVEDGQTVAGVPARPITKGVV